MGNYSRNTYDPSKGYASVRLQQGVPLVDADWNEAADVLRNELYSAVQLVLPDGFPKANPVLRMFSAGTANDLITAAGPFPLGGRLAILPSTTNIFVPVTFYSQQRWTDPAAAAHDGVAVIPPLTTPTAARTDTIYADVWEQEINSVDDPNLINPAIGVETCVRLRRTVAIRVAEGAAAPPAAPAGHVYLPVAQMNRTANIDVISAAMITDLRVIYATAYGQQTLQLFPNLRPVSTLTAWTPSVSDSYSPSGSTYAYGILDLPLPDRARGVSVSVQGNFSGAGNLYVYLWQIGSTDATTLSTPSFTATAAGAFYVNAMPAASYVVDRTQFAFGLAVYAVSSSQVTVNPIQLNYTL